ncbi:cardiolipin synthase [Geothrix sp.]|uniref:cardiolipin synthase n=1 Tax=Geothrix sp. TaxID=1962974 RepID=UPI0025C07345|nr:cardiolipin synthase [Geothrix sp.]
MTMAVYPPQAAAWEVPRGRSHVGNSVRPPSWARLLLVTGLLLSGCARLPEVNYRKAPLEAPATPSVVDGQGTLSDKDAASVLARRLGHSRVNARVLAGLEEAATGRPLIAGNKVTLLFDGPKTISAMMAAASEAKDSINLETYLFDQDPLGMKFAELLIAKQKAGIQVSIIYDCVGTLGTPQAFFDRMQEAGIRLLPFQPVSPLHRPWRWRINNRDHRKILVVDGKVAFAGGVNITEAYSRGSSFRSRSRPIVAAGWRDTHIQIEGPAVAALQWMFLDNWASQQEGNLPERDYFPELPSMGDKVLRVLKSQPGSNHEIFKAYLLAIQGATKSIHITAAYFIPDAQMLKALLGAAKRGVEVKIILPNISDSWLSSHARRSFYAPMLKAGIRVHELKSSVLHAKTAVIDGGWSTVGSTNMDMRSFLHNKEVNIIVLGDGFGREMEDAFREDLRDSREITLVQWNDRPRGQRFKEWFARLFAYWL